MEDGHCGLPTEELVPLAEKLLEVPQQLIRTALELELHDGTVIADRVGETACVFLTGLHRAERTIAERLLRLAKVERFGWTFAPGDKVMQIENDDQAIDVKRRVGIVIWQGAPLSLN
jgi:exodeoxyribonuclease V alpha subunit